MQMFLCIFCQGFKNTSFYKTILKTSICLFAVKRITLFCFEMSSICSGKKTVQECPVTEAQDVDILLLLLLHCYFTSTVNI